MNPSTVISAAVAAVSAASLTAYGGVSARSQMFGPTVRHTASVHKLAITFDDGPNPSITPQLLDLLDRYNARATFFVIGRYARECPVLLRETAARGHAIGNHTEMHPNLFWMTPARIREELRRCQEAIENAVNITPRWFRPPFGFRNPWLAAEVRKRDMRVLMWSQFPGDWRAPTSQWLMDRMKPIAARARGKKSADAGIGDVLCLHDGSHRGQNADRTRTLAALEYWLPRWRDLGLEFATIEEAVSNPAL